MKGIESVFKPRNRNNEMHAIYKREKRGMRKRERERDVCRVVISFTIITTKQNLLLKLKTKTCAKLERRTRKIEFAW